jgi:myo-inositol-1(or 4)-monophosphatase
VVAHRPWYPIGSFATKLLFYSPKKEPTNPEMMVCLRKMARTPQLTKAPRVASLLKDCVCGNPSCWMSIPKADELIAHSSLFENPSRAVGKSRFAMTSFPKAEGVPGPADDLRRIEKALERAASVVQNLDLQQVRVTWEGNDPTTSVDREINEVLREALPHGNEGWLSEENHDDFSRLNEHRVWVVDPVDGTRELLLDIAEWCISIALVEGGRAIAGGVLNPSTGEIFLGADGVGVTVSRPRRADRVPLSGIENRVLVSRREHSEGKWQHVDQSFLTIVPTGSVAYRLAYVAAGLAEATCTLGPRHEWDVAAGVALVRASGGSVQTFNGEEITFNRASTRIEGLLALSRHCDAEVPQILRGRRA